MAAGGFGSVFSHLAFAATLLIAVAGWFTAFIGQCVLEAKYHALGRSGSAVGVPWFGIFLEAFVIVGTVLALAGDNFVRHRLQISVFLAIAVVFAVLGVNSGIFTSTSFQLAVGAGWLLLAVSNILWLLYLTSEEDSAYARAFDSGSGHSFLRGVGSGARRHHDNRSPSALGSNAGMSYANGSGFNHHAQQQQKMPSMTGPAGASVVSFHSTQHRPSEDHLAQRSATPTANGVSAGAAGTSAGAASTGAPASVADTEGDFIFKARALYSYNASPDDPNEISFVKGDLLEITDNSGKWWQARKGDGSRGIAPSNYLQQI